MHNKRKREREKGRDRETDFIHLWWWYVMWMKISISFTKHTVHSLTVPLRNEILNWKSILCSISSCYTKYFLVYTRYTNAISFLPYYTIYTRICTLMCERLGKLIVIYAFTWYGRVNGVYTQHTHTHSLWINTISNVVFSRQKNLYLHKHIFPNQR